MKTFLQLLGLVVSCLYSGVVFAQSFSVPNDTIKAIVSSKVSLHNDITNLSSSPIKVSWKVVSHTLPSSWTNAGFGICDHALCYANTVLNGSTQITGDIDPNTTASFYAMLDGSIYVGPGPYHLVINMTEGSTTKNFVYELSQFTNGILEMNENSNISIYPNPALDKINISIKNNFAFQAAIVTDIAGTVLGRYKINDLKSELDVSMIPCGMYFINFADNEGRIIQTSKFIHK